MSNTFTLDAVRAETLRKFAPVTVELSDGSVVTLSSFLKLNSEDRKAAKTALDQISELSPDDESEDAVDRLSEAMSELIRVIADKPLKLLRELEDPEPLVQVALMSNLVTKWIEETQLGEA